MKAKLTNFHQPPRKVRLVADMIRGKSISKARSALLYMPQKSSPSIAKLLDSAVANARVAGVDEESLFVKSIAVNKGLVMRRARPFARGRSGSTRKTMSIITLELGANAVAKKVAAKKVTKTKKVTKESASAKATGETK